MSQQQYQFQVQAAQNQNMRNMSHPAVFQNRTPNNASSTAQMSRPQLISTPTASTTATTAIPTAIILPTPSPNLPAPPPPTANSAAVSTPIASSGHNPTNTAPPPPSTLPSNVLQTHPHMPHAQNALLRQAAVAQLQNQMRHPHTAQGQFNQLAQPQPPRGAQQPQLVRATIQQQQQPSPSQHTGQPRMVHAQHFNQIKPGFVNQRRFVNQLSTQNLIVSPGVINRQQPHSAGLQTVVIQRQANAPNALNQLHARPILVQQKVLQPRTGNMVLQQQQQINENSAVGFKQNSPTQVLVSNAIHPGHPNYQILQANQNRIQQSFRNSQTNQAATTGQMQIPAHLQHPHPQNNNPHNPLSTGQQHAAHIHHQLQQHQQNQQRLRSRSNSSGPMVMPNQNQQQTQQLHHLPPQQHVNNNNNGNNNGVQHQQQHKKQQNHPQKQQQQQHQIQGQQNPIQQQQQTTHFLNNNDNNTNSSPSPHHRNINNNNVGNVVNMQNHQHNNNGNSNNMVRGPPVNHIQHHGGKHWRNNVPNNRPASKFHSVLTQVPVEDRHTTKSLLDYNGAKQQPNRILSSNHKPERYDIFYQNVAKQQQQFQQQNLKQHLHNQNNNINNNKHHLQQQQQLHNQQQQQQLHHNNKQNHPHFINHNNNNHHFHNQNNNNRNFHLQNKRDPALLQQNHNNKIKFISHQQMQQHQPQQIHFSQIQPISHSDFPSSTMQMNQKQGHTTQLEEINATTMASTTMTSNVMINFVESMSELFSSPEYAKHIAKYLTVSEFYNIYCLLNRDCSRKIKQFVPKVINVQINIANASFMLCFNGDLWFTVSEQNAISILQSISSDGIQKVSFEFEDSETRCDMNDLINFFFNVKHLELFSIEGSPDGIEISEPLVHHFKNMLASFPFNHLNLKKNPFQLDANWLKHLQIKELTLSKYILLNLELLDFLPPSLEALTICLPQFSICALIEKLPKSMKRIYIRNPEQKAPLSGQDISSLFRSMEQVEIDFSLVEAIPLTHEEVQVRNLHLHFDGCVKNNLLDDFFENIPPFCQTTVTYDSGNFYTFQHVEKVLEMHKE